jgi:gas vesicle protein
MMKYAISFGLGALVGAIAALLLAPSSGEELRSNIKSQADAQYAKLQDEWQKGMQEIRSRVDKLTSDFQAVSSEIKEAEQTS